MARHKKKNKAKHGKKEKKKVEEPSEAAGEVSKCEVIVLAENTSEDNENGHHSQGDQTKSTVKAIKVDEPFEDTDARTVEPEKTGRRAKKLSKGKVESLESDAGENRICEVIEVNVEGSTKHSPKRSLIAEHSGEEHDAEDTAKFKKKRKHQRSRSYRSHEVSEISGEADEVVIVDLGQESPADRKKRRVGKDKKKEERHDVDISMDSSGTDERRRGRDSHHQSGQSRHSPRRNRDNSSLSQDSQSNERYHSKSQESDSPSRRDRHREGEKNRHHERDSNAGRDHTREERGSRLSTSPHLRDSASRRDYDGHRRDNKSSSRSQERENSSSREHSWREDRYKDRNSNTTSERLREHSHGVGDRIIECETHAAIVLHESEKLLVRGRAQVQCLYGLCNILGYNLTPSEPPHPVYSPNSSSNISIQASKPPKNDSSSSKMSMVEKMFEEHGFTASDVADFINKIGDNSSLLLLSKLTCHVSNFVSCVSPYQGLFDTEPVVGDHDGWHHLPGLQTALQISSSNRGGVNITHEQEKAIQSITTHLKEGGTPIVAACGGKNVGKSTTTRILLNSLLNHCSSVAYLECDPGQTEFTAPACLGLTLVTHPIFGPPFTHQRGGLRQCFLGAVTPSNEPGHYTRCIEFVFEKYASLNPRPPLVVNTMGWNKGLGLAFLADTLRLIQPDFVIQLNSRQHSRNMQPVDDQFLAETRGWKHMETCADIGIPVIHPHIHLPMSSPVSDHTHMSRYHPADFRDMALLANLAGLTALPSADLMAIAPYRIPWKDVAVHITHSTLPFTQVMYAINASVVALCEVSEDKIQRAEDAADMPGFFPEVPVCECIGLGIIRAIDPVEKVFLLLTPLDASKLSRVNCMLRGTLDLPPSIVMKKSSKDEDVPYVGESKDVTGATSIKRRRHMQRRRPSPHHP